MKAASILRSENNPGSANYDWKTYFESDSIAHAEVSEDFPGYENLRSSGPSATESNRLLVESLTLFGEAKGELPKLFFPDQRYLLLAVIHSASGHRVFPSNSEELRQARVSFGRNNTRVCRQPLEIEVKDDDATAWVDLLICGIGPLEWRMRVIHDLCEALRNSSDRACLTRYLTKSKREYLSLFSGPVGTIAGSRDSGMSMIRNTSEMTLRFISS